MAGPAPTECRRSWPPWPPGWCGHHRGTPNPRASWNDAAAGSRPRSCPGGASPRPRISTTSSPIGWPLRTPGWCARSRPSPAVGSRSTRRRCWACRRLLGRPDGDRPHVQARADLERVQVKLDDRLVADHPRLWARGLTITDTAHVEIAARLRREFQQPRPQPTRVRAAPTTRMRSDRSFETKRESKVRRRIRTLMAAPLVEEVAVDGRGPIETPPDGTRHRRTNARVARRPR